MTGYRVYRGTTAGEETALSGVSGTSFTDHEVSNGTTYFYTVAALNDVGASGQSEEVSATPRAGVAPGPPSSPSVRVCAGLRGCHVMARADVNGDGRRDVVALARRGGRAGARGVLILRVKVGPARVVQARRRLDNWTGPAWLGVSRLDGRRGKEIVVGRLMGAAASFYQAITWRHGRLVLLDAPGRGRWWSLEHSATLIAGWQRRPSDPVGTVRRRIATHGPQAGPYQGTIKAYQWTRSGWRLVGSERVESLPLRRALRWGRFDVPGLRRG